MTPPTTQSRENGVQVCARSLSPFGYAQLYSTNGKQTIISLVPRLLRERCPVAVFWAIILFAVLPVDAVIGGWRDTHVFEERLERGAPSVTDRDAPSAIINETDIERITASALHALPDAVYASAGHAVGAHSIARFPGAITSARLSVAKLCCFHRRDISAITAAFPNSPHSLLLSTPLGALESDHRQESLSFVRPVYRLPHADEYSGIEHREQEVIAPTAGIPA